VRVLFKSPAGSAQGKATIQVAFNQPMVPLGKVKSREEAPSLYPIEIDPPVEAVYRWVGGDILKVDCTKPLRNATEYRVRLLPSLRSLAGTALEEPVEWRFETPRPRVTSLWIERTQPISAEHIHPADRFRAGVNQLVRPEALARVFSLSVEGKIWPVEVSQDPKKPYEHIITPKQPLPLWTGVLLSVAKGLEGEEGKLRGVDTAMKKTRVYGRLGMEVQCDRRTASLDFPCWPMASGRHDGLRLVFTEPVSLEELARHLKVTPPIRDLRKVLQKEGRSCNIEVPKGKPRVPCSRSWRVGRDLQPAARHVVRLDGAMKDVWGQRLGEADTAVFRTRDYPPGLHLPRGGEAFRETWHPWEFKATNVVEVDARLHAFTGPELARFVTCLRKIDDGNFETCLKGAPPKVSSIRLAGLRNTTQTARLALPPGLAAIRLSSPQVLDHAGRVVRFRQLAIQTDLGLHVRLTPFGLHAWVTSLGTGLAVPEVLVTVYDPEGKSLGSGKTDASGMLRLGRRDLNISMEESEPPAIIVTANRGRDWAYTTPGAELQGRDGQGRRSETVEDIYYGSEGSSSEWVGDRPVFVGHVSTERGIYRPGHEVHFHGAVREFQAWRGSPAVGQEVEVLLEDGSGLALGQARVRTSDHGVFLARLPLPEVGRLGRHRVTLRRGSQTLATHGFRVEEYQAPEFTTHVRLAPDPVMADSELQVAMEGRYLFGGAMGGAGYRLRLTGAISRKTWDQWKGYHAGADTWSAGLESQVWHRSEGVLDGLGRRTLRLSLGDQPKAHVPWPGYQSAEVELRSATRRTVASWHSVIQMPGERLVAVRPMPAAKKNELRFHLRVLDPGGRPQAAREVEVKMLGTETRRYRRVVLWEKTLHRTSLPVGPKGAELAVPWPKDHSDSQAFLLLAVKDAKGREARTGLVVYRPSKRVLRYERAQRVEKEKEEELSLKLDRDEYLPGQTALVTITKGSGVKSAALFVEREAIFKHELLRFGPGGQALVRLPVEEAYASEVTLRVVGVRSGKELRGEKGPLLSVKETLNVSDDPFRLQVSMRTDQRIYRPGGKVTVSLDVSDGLNRARPAEVVLMAVDEAVLNLTRYHLPDPLRGLMHTPGLEVREEDVRRFLVALGVEVVHQDHSSDPWVGGWGAGFGGGGAGGSGFGHGGMGMRGKAPDPPKPRKTFRTTAYHGSVVTDKKGHARVTFTLPDNLTSYRIMALAVDKERSSGRGQVSFKVDQPLLALPALPRHLREGDRAEAGVVLYSATSPTGPAKVAVKVQGDAVALEGPTTKTVRLVQGGSEEVRFAMRAKKKGTATLTYTVEKDDKADVLEVPLLVTRPALPEAASVSGQTDTAVRHGVEPLSGLRPDIGGLEVSLASTALTGVEDGMDQLLEYPYGCAEQVSSQLLPLFARAVLGDRFGIKLPQKPGPYIRDGLRKIFAMQNYDGGFSYWPGTGRSWSWVTAYVLVVLHRAQRAAAATGQPVPNRIVERALRYLEHAAGNKASLGTYWYSYEVFLRYALALHGRQVEKPALALYEVRKHQPLFARALLLATLALQRPTPAIKEARARLETELGDSLRIDGTTAHAEEGLSWDYQLFMHSNDRTSAMVLHALLLSNPEHPMLTRLVRWFLVGRKQARFRNTQEAAWALLAMWDFAEIREKDVPDFEAGIWLGTSEVMKTRFVGRTSKPVLRNIPMADLMRVAGLAAKDLTVAKRGKGTLYYVARLRYARTELPAKPRDHGIEIQREVTVLDNAGAPLTAQRPPRLGDTLLVTLRVTSREARRYLVVDDPLPAGLESIDTTLATSSGQDAVALGSFVTSSYDHRELRDDRALFFKDFSQAGTLVFRYLARVTTPGSFLVPPARAEEMYNPEIFGHNATQRVSYPAK
jgi:uncharacterized protein YfaS (alpha-2-macroglobulin family)